MISATLPGCTMRVLKSNDFRLTSMLSDDLDGWIGGWMGGLVGGWQMNTYHITQAFVKTR